MNNIDHRTRFYSLFPSFLNDAEKMGFIRDPRQWSAIYHVLENIDNTSRLKYFISPVLCTSPDQQAEFYKLYDHWFDELEVGLQEEEKIVSSFDSVGPSPPERNPDTYKQPILHLDSGVTNQDNGLCWWQWLIIFVPLSIPAIAAVRLLGWSNPASIIALFFLFLSSIWVIRRWKNRKLVVRQERTDRGDTFWNFHVPPHRLIAFGPEFKRLSTRLRERVPGKVSRLNIRNTVRKTALANGFLSLQFRVNTEIPRCLMLIDLSNENNHRAALFDAFYFWLKDNDVPVVRFYYRSVPNLLWNEDIPKGIPLTTLAARYAESRLFLLGDGWRLLQAETGEPNASAQVFRSWNDRVLITPIPFPQWTGRERSLESLFVIAPFTVDGLKIIEKHLNPEEPFDWELQRPDYWHEESILFDEAALPDSLYIHFSDPAMREWLAALSFYPELNWNLTLFLGDLIGKMNGRSLLTFENLRQLSRIYWFYNGFIPTRARESLYKILKDQKEKTQIIHGRIAEILEEQLKHKEEYYSADRNSLYLQILLHKAHAGAASRAEIKELRQLAKETKEDFLIARYTNRAKPWEWELPPEFSFLLPKGGKINEWWRDFSEGLAIAKTKEGSVPGLGNAEHYVEDETKEVLQEQQKQNILQELETEIREVDILSSKSSLIVLPVKTFICYAHEDREVVDGLREHLTIYEKNRLLEIWYDGKILAGEKWDYSIKNALKSADLILMFISANFLNSDYIEKVVIQEAFMRHRAGEATLIPIIVSSCDWGEYFGLGQFQALPKDAKPILSRHFQHKDDAYHEVAIGIKRIAQNIGEEKRSLVEKAEDEKKLQEQLPDTVKVDDFEYNNAVQADMADARKVTATARQKNLPEMILVKGGTFQMGDKDIAAPVHSVTLSDFEIGKFPVTQKLWSDIMGSNPSYFKGDNLPVEQVSWDDCQKFLKKLSQKTGKRYRLPTEAEWEFAARGGTFSKGFQYAGSNDLNEVGWYSDNSYSETHPVDLKNSNELGLYDMSGNVWEWCADRYGDYWAGGKTVSNPSGPTYGSDRVLRGGSWNYDARFCRVAHRNYITPEVRNNGIGFRLASSPQ